MTFSVAEIEAARAGTEDLWSTGNDALYRLCAECPRHDTPRDIIAKLWLIGRAYTAAIERRPTSREATKIPIDEYYRRAAAALARSGVDAHLAEVAGGHPNSPRDLGPVLRAHAAVVSALHSLSGTHQRSFASKYLHFHAPNWFFIQDSIATRGLQRLRIQASIPPEWGDLGDEPYRIFVSKAWVLRAQLTRVSSPPLTPRQLDRFLLGKGA